MSARFWSGNLFVQSVKTHTSLWLIRSNLTEKEKVEIDQNSIKRTEISHGLNFSLHGLLPVGASDVTKIAHNSLSIIHSRSLAFLFQDFLSPLGRLMCAPRCGEGAQSNLSAELYLFHCYCADWREKDRPWFRRRLQSSWQQRKKISDSPTFLAWMLWQWWVLPTRFRTDAIWNNKLRLRYAYTRWVLVKKHSALLFSCTKCQNLCHPVLQASFSPE